MDWNKWRPVRFMRLMNRGFAKYKGSIIILVVLGFVSGILEGVGINSVVPLFSFLTGNKGGPQDPITQAVQNLFLFAGVDFNLKYLLIFIALLFLLRSITLLTSTYIKTYISANYEARTRKYLFASFIETDWPYLLQQKLGYLETVIMTNVRNSSAVLEQFCALIIVITSLIVYLFVAFNISAMVTAATLGLGIVIFLFLRPSFGNTKRFSQEIEKINKKIAHFLNENIYGMKTVKVMSAGFSVLGIGNEYFETYKKTYIKIMLLRSVADVLMQPIGIIFICILFAFSYKTTAFQLGAFAAVIYLIQRIFIYFQMFQASFRSMNENAPYLQAMLAMEDEIKRYKEIDNGQTTFVFKKLLEFNDVNFDYSTGKITLSDVNLSIERGQTVGLIGPSGSGKTTIVDLVLRLFKPKSGEIKLDGKNIDQISLGSWRSNIGYVSQDIFLTNDTIANNILFYQQGINLKEMEEVAKKANIYDFIQTLPQKFDTIVGERGTYLSVGQRQRLIIARVLARKPQLLILDEATSALDNESEHQIQKVIEGLRGQMTVLIIAHRLSTVLGVDKIVVLSEGRIIEEGKPSELLGQPESYLYKVYHLYA